jgi:hypothetical protein
LTVAEIADLIQEDLDDDVRDPDYEDKTANDSSSSSDTNSNFSDDDAEKMEVHRGELRVYLDPPKERPDAVSDADSGKQLLFLRHKAQSFSPIVIFFFVSSPKKDKRYVVSRVAEPHHFYAAPDPAPGKNFDAAPDLTLLYTV